MELVLVVVVLDVVVTSGLTTARPLAETANHLAPKATLPWPFVWPARLSSAYVYSGWRLYVTCRLPFARLAVPTSDALTPGPVVGLLALTSGGQYLAQLPLQELLPFLSFPNR